MDHDEMSQAGGREARSATSSDVADRRMARRAGALGLGAVALGACALGATAIERSPSGGSPWARWR